MKIKYEFVKREIAGETYLVPVGEGARVFHGMMALNEVGSSIWDLLGDAENEEEIAKKLSEEYEATDEELLNDTKEFVEQLRKLGMIE